MMQYRATPATTWGHLPPSYPITPPSGMGWAATLLAPFAPIELAEMQSVALLDRVEVKYVMHSNDLRHLLPRLTTAYRVLEVEGQRLNHYRTLYFDTADFALYRRHHAGARVRYKVRAREYLDTHASFLEVKHKTNRRHTVKSRIATPALLTALDRDAAGFVQEHSPYTADELTPVLWNSYTRITLVSKSHGERVTLDTDLAFVWGTRQEQLPGIVVAEVKQPSHSRNSDFVALMREYHIRSAGFSKYCIGVSLLYPEIKHNRFKRVHRRLARLAQGGYDVDH